MLWNLRRDMHSKAKIFAFGKNLVVIVVIFGRRMTLGHPRVIEYASKKPIIATKKYAIENMSVWESLHNYHISSHFIIQTGTAMLWIVDLKSL